MTPTPPLNTPPARTAIALPERLPEWGVLLLESHHSSGFSMEWRTHSFVKLIYVLSGRGHLEIDTGTRFEYRPRDVLVLPPAIPNRLIDDPNEQPSLYILCLDQRLLQFDSETLPAVPTGRLRRSPHFANQTEQRLRRLLYTQSRPTRIKALRMVAEALQVLTVALEQPLALVDADDKTPEPIGRREIEQYVAYLDNHFYEATSLEAAANQVGLPRRQFTEQFRDYTGMSWLEYVRGRAIEHAVHLLTRTQLPITSVAFECGFEDLSTFYRRFKRAKGVAPSAYRVMQPSIVQPNA